LGTSKSRAFAEKESSLRLSRRGILQGGSALAVSLAAFRVAPVLAQDISPADLAEAGPLGDVVMGDDKAPVTMIEYASMTCPHCAAFSTETLPKLKEQYIDTGKMKYILREFPLDPIAAGAFMLARCRDKDQFYPVVELLFSTQRQWAVQNPLEPLFKVVKQTGFTDESFKACLANQKILDGIQAVRDKAAQKFNVQSTPTFFINGKRVVGALPLADFQKEIDAQLKS
jgi:protein-disulfide isomerase